MALAGRDRELASLARWREAASGASVIVRVEGPAGIGKSALIAAAADLAAGAGWRVLRCAPTAAEAELAYAALGDLLAPVEDLAAVPEVPRHALEHVLLRRADEPPGGIDARLVGSACAAAWAHLRHDAPLLLVVDDVHWLDAASAEAMRFALRRLPPDRVLVLAGRRTGEPGPAVPGELVAVGPLGDDHLAAAVRAVPRRDDRVLSQREVRSIVEAAHGNPLFATELARHALRVGGDGALAVPPTLEAVLEDRFGRIADDVHDALLAVALLARPSLDVLRAVGALPGIEAAERDGIVDTSAGRVELAHPLFAATVLQRATPSEQRAWHRRLAAVLTDPVEVVRHAALGADAPDRVLAAQLDVVVEGLAAKGAREHAADLALLAIRTGPVGDPGGPDRLVRAARLSFERGDSARAVGLLAELDRLPVGSRSRRRELVVRAQLAFAGDGTAAARAHATAALAWCTTDAERIEVHQLLADVEYDDFRAAAEHAAIALDLARRGDVGPAVLAGALRSWAGTRFMVGEGLDHEAFHQAIDLQRDVPVFVADSAFGAFAVLRKVADELDEARDMLVPLLGSADDGALPFALSHLPQLELWSGNWDAAEDYAQRHLDAAERAGQADQVSQARSNLAMIAAYRGEMAQAAEIAAGIAERGRATGDLWTLRSGLGLLGIVALGDGQAERAVDLLAEWDALGVRMGLGEPGYCRMQADYVEALVATGRLDVAADQAAAMAAAAERLDRRSLRSGAARARALVLAVRGDRDGAVAAACAAVEHAAATPLVVERARAELTLGQIHRRFKEKAAARAALQSALEEFERLGAERLAGRARQDLARLGLRPPASRALTETERRVAELAGTGKTVRQVGDELFISPKTVEANLTRVYRKLHLSGRAELAAWLAGQRAG